MFKDVDVQEIEKKKKDQELESNKRPTNMKERFGQSNLDILEEEFKIKTVGLVTREEFKRKRENIDDLIEQDNRLKKAAEIAKRSKEKLERKEQQSKKTNLLSFDVDNEEVPEEANKPEDPKPQQQQDDKRGYGKDGSVNTTFLPDTERDQQLKELKRKFAEEFQNEQETIKNQLIDIKFQYWDGSYIVKSLTVKKNTTVLKFLEDARKEIIKDFAFIKEFSPEDLIIVMKDMILPHKLTFYDMISHKIKNKSGHPLFVFDKMKVPGSGSTQEIEVEIEKSGTAKIIEKFKYDKISHIYPCSIWEQVEINKFK